MRDARAPKRTRRWFSARGFRSAIVLTAGLVALVASQVPVLAIELVVVERDGCPWCVRWDREVGSLYHKTPEGQAVPLRKVNLDRPGAATLQASPPVRYTPTFLLMDDGREIGRITGYMGDDAFWGLYSKMVRDWQAKAGSQPSPAKK